MTGGEDYQVMRDRLKEIIIETAITIAETEFTLKSGKKSRYYYNCKNISMNPEAATLIGHIFHIHAEGTSATHVGGPESGAIPMATAIAMASWECSSAGTCSTPLEAFFVRKEPKGHGTKNWVEGKLPPGSTVVVIEDVVTSGGSLMKAIDNLLDMDCKIAKVITLVDRMEGGQNNFLERGLDYEAIYTHEEFLPELEEKLKAAGK